MDIFRNNQKYGTLTMKKNLELSEHDRDFIVRVTKMWSSEEAPLIIHEWNNLREQEYIMIYCSENSDSLKDGFVWDSRIDSIDDFFKSLKKFTYLRGIRQQKI